MNKYFGRKDLSQLQLLRIGRSSPRCRQLRTPYSEVEERIEQKLQIWFLSAIFLSLAVQPKFHSKTSFHHPMKSMQALQGHENPVPITPIGVTPIGVTVADLFAEV